MSFRVQKTHKFVESRGENKKQPNVLTSSSSSNKNKPNITRQPAPKKPDGSQGLSVRQQPRATEDYY